MSKITFRADDELITQLEEFDASKSEIMREALREYLESRGSAQPVETTTTESDSLDEIVTERVDMLIADRLDGAFTPQQPQDINVNISLDGDSGQSPNADDDGVNVQSDTSHETSNNASHSDRTGKTPSEVDENTPPEECKTCTQCGEDVSQSHVYCPNCGEKSSHRVFCECGDELRSDWGFCPSCGRRTAAADVLEER
ncbi:zinc ribbon domain-containing protein [Halovenus rubra]|uniref:Zinc ribbon domain-containing protein n=2 Tax=Halovenus rubra TaxID=869890 RepID=A0ABD5X5J1_9EURY|nr:zinc ribbon domain-containing protein [Halovenus rubra]